MALFAPVTQETCMTAYERANSLTCSQGNTVTRYYLYSFPLFASTVYVGLVSFAFYTQLESLFPRRALSLHNVFLKGLLRCARFELGRENTSALAALGMIP